MRRVLVYAPRVLPGSQTFVADQARALSRWTPALVGRERVDGGLFVDDLLADEMDDSRTQPGIVGRTMSRTNRQVRTVEAAAARISPALIHAHFLTGGFDVMASLRPPPCPVVVTAHGFDVTWYGAPPATMRPARWLHGVLRRRLVRQPVHFIAVSRFIRDQLLRYGASEDAVVVHHTGVDTTAFTPPPGARHRQGVLFVGRLVEKKGVLDLLEAVAGLRSIDVNTPVEIIGDGPQRPAIERFVKRQRLEVTLRGAQPREAVIAAMQRSAVLCSPSRADRTGDREGFGMVLAEAQATGLPVVASRCGGMVDAVDHSRTGLLVPEGDVGALREALSACLTDADLRRRLGEAARPWVLERFDLSRQTAVLERHYDSWSAGL